MLPDASIKPYNDEAEDFICFFTLDQKKLDEEEEELRN